MALPNVLSRLTPILFALGPVMGACASNPPLGSPESAERVHLSSQSNDIDLAFASRPEVSTDSLSVSAQLAFSVLPSVYAELRLPIASMDTAKRTIAGATVTARRQFGGKSLSNYIECGSTVAGHTANIYEVRFNVVSRVTAKTADRSLLSMLLSAHASSDGGEAVLCSSTGRLELLIARTLKQALGR